MCGRYEIDIDEIEIREIIDEISKNIGNDSQVKIGEIFPTNPVPVLTFEKDKTKPAIMEWGFPNFRNKGVIINARAETVLEKRTFRESLLSRRCIIPATGFFEWKENGNRKDKYLFTLPQSPVLYIAGFYNSFNINNVPTNRFVILTTAANESMHEIHDRMPIVLKKDILESWVADNDTAINILQDTPPNLDKVIV